MQQLRGMYSGILDAIKIVNSEWDGTDIPLPVSIANGGTGATTVAEALSNLGIASVVEETGTSSTWDYIMFDTGLVIAWGLRDCTFPNATNLGTYFRSIETLDLSALISTDTTFSGFTAQIPMTFFRVKA